MKIESLDMNQMGLIKKPLISVPQEDEASSQTHYFAVL